jgi:hypothetical protein
MALWGLRAGESHSAIPGYEPRPASPPAPHRSRSDVLRTPSRLQPAVGLLTDDFVTGCKRLPSASRLPRTAHDTTLARLSVDG